MNRSLPALLAPVVLAGAMVALSACSSSTSAGTAAASPRLGWPTPLSGPKITLTAPPAPHDYGPPPPNAGHVAPGTDAAVALAADAKAARAKAASQSG